MQIVTYKVPAGKLLRLKAEVENGKLSFVQLSGDFFLSPPEKLQLLEVGLLGQEIANTDALREALHVIVTQNNIVLYGITVEAIVDAIAQLQQGTSSAMVSS